MGESSGQTYRTGDRVEVRVEAVNMDERKIDFSLISSERAPHNVGKTAREKAKKAMQASVVRSVKRLTLSQTAPSAVRKTKPKAAKKTREKRKSHRRKRRK